MSDSDPQQHGRDSDQYRPFDDPRHPSWYSDASDRAGQSASGQPTQPDQAAARNPYADQPLAGPYGNGQPQYPIQGGYPVVTHQPRRPGEPYPAAGPYGARPHGAGTPAHGMAIASMVLGIIGIVTVGMLFVPQVLAIILGHLGMNKGRESRGFAIAGLVMGYLVTGFWILAILGFMTLGMFSY